MWDPFFPLLFPKDSQSLTIFDIRLWEVGAKRHLNGSSKVNRRTDKQTDKQTDRRTNRRTFWLIESIGPEQRADAMKMFKYKKSSHVSLETGPNIYICKIPIYYNTSVYHLAEQKVKLITAHPLIPQKNDNCGKTNSSPLTTRRGRPRW